MLIEILEDNWSCFTSQLNDDIRKMMNWDIKLDKPGGAVVKLRKSEISCSMDISPELVVKVLLKCMLEKNEKGLIQEQKNGSKNSTKIKKMIRKLGVCNSLIR